MVNEGADKAHAIGNQVVLVHVARIYLGPAKCVESELSHEEGHALSEQDKVISKRGAISLHCVKIIFGQISVSGVSC